MKTRIIIIILTIAGYSGSALSQTHTDTRENCIPIEELLQQIDSLTTYSVYASMDTTFCVFVDEAYARPLETLEKIFAGTNYGVYEFDNNLFIIPNRTLVTTLPSSLTKKAVPGGQSTQTTYIPQTEKATSENKVYTIGNMHIKELPATATLTGKVTDFRTGEPLVGTNIILKEPWTATATDKDGNFTIQLPTGRLQLDISGLNIKESRRQIMLYGNGVLDIELEEESHLLDEVTITSGRIHNVKNTQMGVERIQISRIKNIPTALGEVDILKVIQSLPGIKTVGEASTGFNVRGGATDQNLILLNDGTIYNSNHLFGFFTAFSSDMIKDAEIYKSSIPAKYGGRISSVLDINVKEANKEKFTGSAGIGLVTSKLNLEVPIIKGKTSVLLSGRTTYSDWILKQIPEKSGYKNGTAGFYDVGANFSHKINEKNLVNVFGYYSHDRFDFNKNQKYAYNNMNISAKWRTVFSDKLFAYFTGGYDHYDYENAETLFEESSYKLSFNINQMFAKVDFSYNILPEHAIDFGFKTMYYDIDAGKFEPVGEKSLIKFDKLQKDKALESAFYISDQWDITNKFSINAGIRYSIFNALGPRTYNKYNKNVLPDLSSVTETISVGSGKVFKTYHGPEFRLSTRYAFEENLSVKAGFNSMRQYIHKLSNTAIMSPTDTWKLSDTNISPQKGWQAATGLYYNTPNGLWEFSTEVYYKKMNDYLDYRGGAKILMNHNIETDVIKTEGKSYGVEVSVKKVAGKLNGWASYTFSRTFLRQSDKLIENPVNQGNWYPTQYDKPHDFKLVGNYKFTERYSISVNLDYSTGRPITLPAGKFYDTKYGSYRVYYTDRNSYRIPDYFRTDIAFNIEPSHKLTLLTHSSISIGVYNLTGRKNIYSIYYLVEQGQINGYKMSIFGIPIPFITYNIRF